MTSGLLAYRSLLGPLRPRYIMTLLQLLVGRMDMSGGNCVAPSPKPEPLHSVRMARPPKTSRLGGKA